jgi:hypothetical protein
MAGIILALLVVADIAGALWALLFEVTPFVQVGEAVFWGLWILLGGIAGVLSYVACIGIAVSGQPGDMRAMDARGAKAGGRIVLGVITAICLLLDLVLYFLLGDGGVSHYVPRSATFTAAKLVSAVLGAGVIQLAQERRKEI